MSDKGSKELEIIARMRDYKDFRGITNAELALEIEGLTEEKMSEYTVKKMLSNTYVGDTKRISGVFELFLTGVDTNPEVIEDTFIQSGPVTETKCVIKVSRQVIRTAMNAKRVALICGKAGLGKTTAIHYLKNEIPGAVVVKCRNTHTQQLAFMRAIVNALNIEPTRRKYTTDHAVDLIVESLQNRPRTLIFDDAHFLKVGCFALLISIMDESDCPPILFGQPQLARMIRGRGHDELERFESRSIVCYLQPKYTEQEIASILHDPAGTNLSKEVIRELTLRANTHLGALRTRQTEVSVASSIARKKKREITTSDIQNSQRIFLAV